MTSVADARKYLEQLIAADNSAGGEDLRAAAKVLLTELARADDKSLSEFSQMFLSFFSKRRTKDDNAVAQRTRVAPTARSVKGAEEEERFLSALRSHVLDDRAFADDLNSLEDCRAVGREGINRIYNALFDRSRSLPSKASRAKLVRDILDQRVVTVRSKKAADLLLGRIVPAE